MDDLVTVTIRTKLSAEYVFPDMPRAMLERVIRASNWEQSGSVVLVNVSQAVLTLPIRVVESLSYDGAVRWPLTSPV